MSTTNLWPGLRPQFCPTGPLRAAINLGNPILAGLNAQGQPEGISVDMAQALADQLGVPLALTVVQTAKAAVDALAGDAVDVGFFAVDPARAEAIAFTAPYVLIEGCYAVPQDSPILRNDDVDRAGHRIVVGNASAYDLYLSREIRQATLVRAPSSQDVVRTYLAQGAEVAAGVKQQLLADLAAHPGHRLLDGRFMVIQQAMGVAKRRGEPAAAALAAFVETMKASGFVADAMQRHRASGASVAPAAAG